MDSFNLTLYAVRAMLILDGEGERLLANYYTPPHQQQHASAAAADKLQLKHSHAASSGRQSLASLPQQQQRTFEKGLVEKTKNQNGDVILFDGQVVLYKHLVDATIYVVGGMAENELMLHQVVVGFRDALEYLLKQSTDRQSILDNYDLVALAADELVDDGIIIETDGMAVSQRISRSSLPDGSVKVDLSEQGLLNAYQMAKEIAKDRFLKGGL